MDLKKLQDYFPAEDIEWRIGQSGKNANGFYAKAFAYITNRAIMQRLDDVCGPEHWQNTFEAGPNGGVVCGIAILCPEPTNGRIFDESHPSYYWVTKWDGAENTDIESVKGGLSDAMKRAGVQWGIGRYLYNLEETWVECSEKKIQGWHYAQTKDKVPFYWKTPELPSWALPNDAKVVAKPATKKRASLASPEQIQEIVDLCQKLGKDVTAMWKHYGVDNGKPTPEQYSVIRYQLTAAVKTLTSDLNAASL